MRAYVPIGWPQVEALRAQGQIAGPLRACVVDPAWRAGAPEVDEEEWEYEAQAAAAAALGGAALGGAALGGAALGDAAGGGVVLAVDVDGPGTPPEDGWTELAGPVALRDVAAVLDAELAWFGVQEIDQLLAGR